MRPYDLRNAAFVADDVLPDPDAYRRQALAKTFQTVDGGGVPFHGIAQVEDSALIEWLGKTLGLTTTLTFLRRSPFKQAEPNFIHTDVGMGDWTAVLYLNPQPPKDDGTSFWIDSPTGRHACPLAPTDAQYASETKAWRDRERWVRWRTVAAVFNRVVVFPSAWYHSRAAFDNYGDSDKDSDRLIQVAFCSRVQ